MITALPVIMAITVWQWTGLTFVLYFAAMAQIDQSVLEAARMDGAGNLRVLASIIWPGVRGTTPDGDIITPSVDKDDRPDQGGLGQDLLWPGEFVFGYPGQDPQFGDPAPDFAKPGDPVVPPVPPPTPFAM